MGMLQLAGMVSGFGKGLQQGLQQTQQYMSHSLLLKEREEMELARQKLTFAHDEGMLQKRAKIEADAAGLAHSRARDLAEDREDFEIRRDRIGRDAARTDATTQAERTQQNTVTNKILDASIQQQRDADQAKRDRAKEERTRQAEREKQQGEIGKEIVTETIRNQRPHAGSSASGEASGKWDDQTKARYKSLVAEIADIKESLYGLVKAPEKERPGLKRKLDTLQQEHDELVGRQSTPSKRNPIQWPE